MLLIEKTGIPYWVYTVGEALRFQPEAQKDKVYIVGVVYLHILDKKSGEVRLKKELNFVPCSSLCATDEYLYVGGWDNFVYCLNANTGDREWRYRIDGHIWGKPTVLNGVLYIASTDNRVYAIGAYTGYTEESWGKDGRYSTRAANVVKVVPQTQGQKSVLYVGSRDYNLYCLGAKEGFLQWKFETGGEINQTPYHMGTSVYVISSRKLDKKNSDSKLYVVDSNTGLSKWSLDHAKQLFFVGKKHDWVAMHGGKIASLKTDTGKLHNIYDTSSFSLYLTNVEDTNIGYLATNDGYIFAVEEQ